MDVDLSQELHDDVKYVAKIKRVVSWWERLRWIVMVLTLCCLVAICYVGYQVFEFSRAIDPKNPPNNADDLFRWVIFVSGVGFGGMIHQLVAWFFRAFFGYKAERMLVKYGPTESQS